MDVPLIRPIVLFFYMLLLLMGLMVPSSGSHSAVHPKSAAFVLLSLSLICYAFLFKRVFLMNQFQLLVATFIFLSFAMLWMVLGLFHPRIETLFPFDQFKLFIITAVVVIASLFLYFEKTLTYSFFLKTLLYGNAAYVLFKLLAAAALIFKFVTFEKLTDFLGIRAMGMAIFGDFQRFQTSMDIATPFLIFFSLEAKRFSVKLPKLFAILFPPLAFISTIISFSRVLIFIGFLGFLFYFCLHTLKRFLLGVALFIAACCGLVALIGPHNAAKMVEARLFSRENSASDDARSVQIEALMEEVISNPILGMGMGGYSEREIRDVEIKHSYEVQWVALFSQLGSVGLFIFLLPILFLTIQFLLPPIQPALFAVGILWCGWIASGFTNPFVISLTSGIMYSLFGLTVLKLKEEHAHAH